MNGSDGTEGRQGQNRGAGEGATAATRDLRRAVLDLGAHKFVYRFGVFVRHLVILRSPSNSCSILHSGGMAERVLLREGALMRALILSCLLLLPTSFARAAEPSLDV